MSNAQIRADSAYYAKSVAEFLADAECPVDVLEQLVAVYHARCKQQPSAEQVRAWESAIGWLRETLKATGLLDAYIALEVVVGPGDQRVDVVLCGRGSKSQPRVFLLELKTWHTKRKKERRYEFHVYRPAGGGKSLLVNLIICNEGTSEEIFSAIESDPRQQVGEYRSLLVQALQGMNPQAVSQVQVTVVAAVILYNCAKLSDRFREVLEYVEPFAQAHVPIYTKRAANGSRALADLVSELQRWLNGGCGAEVYKIINEAIQRTRKIVVRPSRAK